MEANRDRDIWLLNSMSRVSWGAIFAGVFVAMLFHLILGLLGLAIGLTVLDPAQQISPQGVSIATGIWLLITSLISIFVGAYTAGRLAGLSARYDGVLHGVVTFAFMVFLSLYLVSTGLSNIIGGAFTYGTKAAQTQVAQQAIPPAEQIQQRAQQQFQQFQQNVTPQERMQALKQVEQGATAAAWWSFITGLLALAIAALGGYLGMVSRIRQVIRD